LPVTANSPLGGPVHSRAQFYRTMTKSANPHCGSLALANSSYTGIEHGHLVDLFTNERPPNLTVFVHDALRALVLNDHFTCHGGKAAVRQQQYRFGLYDQLGSAGAAAGLARDLTEFVADLPSHAGTFSTYLASFVGPNPAGEPEFESLLWRLLQQLHDLDAPHHRWDPTVNADPDSPDFAFSFAGTAFFIIGLHAGSSRAARRFAWPTLVFNPHRQFEELRHDGRYARFQEVIRHAETELQGSLNPMLGAHGSLSQAAQYSGRRVEDGWHCPFQSRTPSAQETERPHHPGGSEMAPMVASAAVAADENIASAETADRGIAAGIPLP
jgi:FPC/CPF motif-containing protein YcgG